MFKLFYYCFTLLEYEIIMPKAKEHTFTPHKHQYLKDLCILNKKIKVMESV